MTAVPCVGLPNLPAWTWRDVTDHLSCRGGDVYVEVDHDAGHTIVEIAENGMSRVWIGVAINWCDVVAADVLGARRHEADLDVLEAARPPEVSACL